MPSSSNPQNVTNRQLQWGHWRYETREGERCWSKARVPVSALPRVGSVATCLRRHLRSTASEHYVLQGSINREGELVTEKSLHRTRSQIKKQTEATVAYRDNQQPPPRRTPPSSRRGARVPPLVWGLGEIRPMRDSISGE